MDSIYYGDVEQRVNIAKGMCMAFNNLYGKYGKAPMFDAEKAEKHIRKTTAKFYGEQSKYNGKGQLR